MAKKYLSLERLTEYDTLIKSKIDAGDASVKSYVDTEVAKKANSSHTHDDRYYTETEIDEKINSIPNYVVRNIEDVTRIVEKSTLVGFYFYLNNPIPNGLYYYDMDKYTGKILTAVIVNKEGTAVDKQFSLFYPYLLKISSDEESVLIECICTGGGTTKYYYDIANKTYVATATSYSATEIDENISNLNTSITEQLALKAESNHTHDDRYYTETEIDSKLSAVNTSIGNITSGSTPVKEAEHATSADSATNANHATSADNATIATSATKATQDGNGKVIADTYETKADAGAKLTEAKSYADSAASKVKDDLLNGAGAAYDTLKELGELIDDNKDAIDALEDIASGKADATHGHAIADVSGLQSALDELSVKADESDVLVVKITSSKVDDKTTYTADKTFTEIDDAINKGNSVIVKYNNYCYYLSFYIAGNRAIFTYVSKFGGCFVNTFTIGQNQITFSSNYFQDASYRTNTISSGLANDYYPSANAVIDYVGAQISNHNHDDAYYTIAQIDETLSNKANATHSHEISEVNGLQSALDGKAASSHGTHVTFDSTNKPKMDGTAAFGTSTKVARADHVHPTDTSRASQTEFDTHVADTTKHITSTERANWGTAYTHSQAAHAPSNAEKNQNAFSNIIVGETTIAADTTTDSLTLVGSNVTITPDATNDKVTIAVASGSTSTAGILKLTNSTSSTSTTTAATPSSVKSAYDLANQAKTAAATAQSTADGKANASHTHNVADITDLTATATELNYMDGVTSSVQTQLDGKAASGHSHSDATTSAAGFMTAAMVTKLNGIATGANKTTVDSTLSSSSTNPVQNKVVNSAIVTATNAITANTNSISTHTSQISALQTAVGEFEEITSAEIQALFA